MTRLAVAFLSFWGVLVALNAQDQTVRVWKRSDLYIRDPFILADRSTETYYLYSSSYDFKGMPDRRMGVVVYKSKDLNQWLGPYPVFQTGAPFWADTSHGVWAPEVHFYKGRYYLFATFTNPGLSLSPMAENRNTEAIVKRGTCILVASQPEGPFTPLASESQTPPEWMALDGTLFVERGKPKMVFCHEWIQTRNGTVEVVNLSKDLAKPIGKPKTLFKATDAPWVRSLNLHQGGFVTDGCWLYRTKSGILLMLWSSFGPTGYVTAIAISESGRLSGPWKHLPQLIYEDNGGHPMLFKTFDGKLAMAIHQPNAGPIRARLFEMADTGEGLVVIKEIPF
ncbi:MAG: family 43 glycosylhydrolase [Haliscomenobacter sp.]|nr:family 43 glycosylhydrolase [Haliscomenobacter sp.]MBP9075227.1 family 43 glycosylhydrolase [Haliscomenobacter sp.]MBP9872400.1 family 43 glycosylhydrolase [Haliscomenobacter sp.]